jgi:hypothetical protein
MPVKFPDAKAKASGAAITYDDIVGSDPVGETTSGQLRNVTQVEGRVGPDQNGGGYPVAARLGSSGSACRAWLRLDFRNVLGDAVCAERELACRLPRVG